MPKPTKEPLVALPANAVDAIGFISASLGEAPTSCIYETTDSIMEVAWPGGSEVSDGYLAFLKWKLDGRTIVQLAPNSPEQWKKAWPIIGWCAFNEMDWQAEQFK
jgi:hypothetical protein